MALLETKNLEKIYVTDRVETPVLQGVSFSVNAGEFVAIMGPSGSGKSTLLHILGFLDRHTRGEYIFDGISADLYSEEEVTRLRNKRIGFIFQMFNLLPRTSILDNVTLPLLYSDVPESQWEGLAKKAIESVGLSHRMFYEPSQLSGGEKQRVAIARALVNDPQIIFADEPTGNLDSKSGSVVMDIIQRLSVEQGRTVILITHETYTAEFAGRIIYVKDGRIESDRKVEQRKNAQEHFIK